MTNTRTNTRDWTWTPPPAMNRMMSTMLKLPVLHRMVSKSILLITFTGRKSGKTFTTPVGYLWEGSTVTILTKRFRKWWQNFVTPAPVTLRLQGRNVQGEAVAITDVDGITPILAHMVEVHPREADIFEVRVENGKADLASVRQAAERVVIIQVTLKS
ncbi:MAG: nitroreductase/quinone reductase family protein [Anaerolineae bacterium]